jgi:hypothetical protein
MLEVPGRLLKLDDLVLKVPLLCLDRSQVVADTLDANAVV